MTIYLYHLLDTLGIIRYVGLTQHINRRKNRHRREKPSHTMEIIQTHQYARLAGIAEQHHIAHHNTLVDGWNKTIGGDGYIPEIGWGVINTSGENNGNWKGGISLDKKEYDRIRRQRPEVILKNRITQRKFYEKNRDEILARRQTPEVRLRNNRNKRIRYARNKGLVL